MKDRTRGIWHKSSYSNGGGGNCIEVARSPEPIRVRDSKDPGGPVLAFSGGAWEAFVQEVRRQGGAFEGA